MKKIMGYVKNEQGIETVEWIAIGAIILAMAFGVYPGVLEPAITTTIGNISAALTGLTF